MSHYKIVSVLCLCVLCLVCLTGPVLAENKPAKNQTAESDWSEYDAVILEAKAVLDHTFTRQLSKETISMKIKFLTPKGIEDYGTRTMEYNHKTENIGDIEGKVILPDGKEIKIAKSDILKKKIAKRGQRKRTEIKVAFPSLEVGAVVEFSYHLTFTGTRPVSTWAFQNDLFTVYSEVNFIPWPGRRWGCSMPNAKEEPETHRTNPGGNTCYHFIRRNIKPLPREPKTLAYSALTESITFYYHDMKSSYDSYWKDGIVDVYKEYFKEMVEPCRAAKKMAGQFAGIHRDQDVIEKIYEFFTQNFIPLGMMTAQESANLDDGTREDVLESEDNGDLFKEKYLTNWQCAYVLSSLIKAAQKDAKVELVFCIPWDEGLFDFSMKSVRQFHDIIVKVTYKDKEYTMCPWMRYVPVNGIDWALKGVKVVAVNEDGAKIEKIPLDKPEDNPEKVTGHVTFDPDEGKATIEKTYEYNQYDSYYYRTLLKTLTTEEERRQIIETKLQNHYGEGTVLNSYEVTNLDDYKKPLIIKRNYTINYEFEELGDQILMDFPGYLSPSSNPFVAPKRYNQICFTYPFIETQEMTYTIPEGYSILSVPENLEMLPGLYYYELKYEKPAENQIKIVSTQKLKGNMMSHKAVNLLRSRYNKVLELQRHKLVLNEE